MEQMLNLMNEKDSIESKIKGFSEILVKNGNIGMNESVVDLEGYPRSDIDVYQVRHARRDIIRLQNDHKAIMKKIEKGLESIHKHGNLELIIDPNGTNAATPTADLVAFALINRVDADSPSYMDGLKENDQICKFGSISADNFRGLLSVGEVVKNSKNKPIQVMVRRENREKCICLTPRAWAGRGFLGCNIIPLDNIER